MKKVCQNCGSKIETSLKVPGLEGVFVCLECEGWMASSSLSLAELSNQVYDETYFNGKEYINYQASDAVQRLNFRRKISLLDQYNFFSKDARILEIGSATGLFLDELKKKDKSIQTMGIEISQYARQIAEKKGHRVLTPESSELFEEIRKFNPTFICAWDVWEHLDSSVDTVTQYLNSSPECQAVALTTVDVSAVIPKRKKKKWRQFHPPSHLNYPSRRSFVLFFKKYDYEVIFQKAYGMYRPLSEYLFALCPILRSWLCRFKILYKIPIYMNLYDIQMVIAEKKNDHQ
ncbi:MAG: hypothetical protein CL678_02950 [Bdellovibrionaceae bacterium]|nr:hypothetical protein [Pseudobdellovibrionaceae bacterium]|tara:strand:- start:5987 stop:6853 length:867 start_codon:yes stop_codon:yes gene_type:complete